MAANEVVDRASLNLARGIGIIAIVFVHINPGFGPSAGTFHIPLFFFLGGITMIAARPWKSVFRFVWRDLILFAVLMSVAYALVGAILKLTLGLQFNGRPLWDLPMFTTDLLVQTSHSVPFALTAWFLMAYAGAVVLCQFVLKRIRQHVVVVCFVLGLVLYVGGVKLIAPRFLHTPDTWYFNYATQVIVGSGFMLLGVAFARFRWPQGLLKSPATLLLLMLAYRLLIWQFHPGDIGMVFSEYPAGVFVGGAAALLGTTIAILLADKLRSRWFAWLASVGAASKHVMAHHLFFLTVLNLMFVAAGWMALADVQNVFSKFAVRQTWPLYLAIGVGGSMALYTAIRRGSAYVVGRWGSKPALSGAKSVNSAVQVDPAGVSAGHR